jgi:hypothetical protein
VSHRVASRTLAFSLACLGGACGTTQIGGTQQGLAGPDAGLDAAGDATGPAVLDAAFDAYPCWLADADDSMCARPGSPRPHLYACPADVPDGGPVLPECVSLPFEYATTPAVMPICCP